MNEPQHDHDMPDGEAIVAGDESSSPCAAPPPAGPPAAQDAADSPAAPVDVLGEGLIDKLARMDGAVISEAIAAPKTAASGAEVDSVGEHLEELADDMLSLLRHVRSIEERQLSLVERLDRLEGGWSQGVRMIAREIDTLRRDAIGDRKHAAATSVINELIPMIDRLRTMRDHLDEEQDSRMTWQLDGVLETLSASLRRLGCNEFLAQEGSPFDPGRMESVECRRGDEPGVVLKSLRPGYMFADVMLRPVLVQLGSLITPANNEAGEKCDE